MSFNFESEMVLGKKHINKLDFDKSKFNFTPFLQELFNLEDLYKLHEQQTKEYEVFNKFGEDSNTEFHEKFYKYLKSENGIQIKEAYEKFIKEVIFPYLGLNKALVQQFPTIRFQLPNNIAVARKHIDSEFHPMGEINFSYAFTDMFDSNTIWIEKMPRSENYVPIKMLSGECSSFNANLCTHYNKINKTGKTRISMDFRILPINCYNSSEAKSTFTRNMKYIDGGYYRMMEIPELKSWQEYLINYRKTRNFNPKTWIDEKIAKFNNYLIDNKLTGAILSVSGGIDSALTLALLQKAKELSNLKKIWAINQPIHSSDWALNRTRELCEKMDVELKVIDQTDIFDSIVGLVDSETGVKSNKFSGGQMRSYMRTPINYYCAQLLTQEGYPAIVMGTGNMDEDGYLAYFCKAGDGVVDVQLISDLHKSEVFKAAEYLGVPMSIVKAQPSADLWEGQEDEKELGFTYDFIEFYTGVYLKFTEVENTMFLQSLTEDSRKEFMDCSDKCTAVHNRNKHKLKGVVNL